MKTASWLAAVARLGVVLGLLFCMYLAAKQGIAAWYFRQGSPETIRTAMKVDSQNPQYPDALARLMHIYSNSADAEEIVQLTKKAVELSPFEAHYWADLGAAYDWAGHPQEALRAMERARELFPNSPGITWQLANFYVRAGETGKALRALHDTLKEKPAVQTQVFALAANATADDAAILADVLPPDPQALVNYLDYQLQAKQFRRAKHTWNRLFDLNLPFNLQDAFPYMDALIQQRDFDGLTQAWSAMARRFPARVPVHDSSANLLTNGNFESDILNGGLDWRVMPTKGVAVRQGAPGPGGTRSLQIAFDGTENVDSALVLQFASVKPGTRYQLSAYMRTKDITTDSGPRFEAEDAYDASKLFISTQSLVGDTDWSEQKTEFKTGPDTRLIIVMIVRPMSHKFDNKISGALQIRNVTLIPEA